MYNGIEWDNCYKTSKEIYLTPCVSITSWNDDTFVLCVAWLFLIVGIKFNKVWKK